MERQRADIGFEDDLDGFNPAEWGARSTAKPRPERSETRQLAEAIGFRSREAAPETAAETAPGSTAGAGEAKPPRRRRTGRNMQFNLKARPDTIERFCAVADAKGWGLGETLEHAVALLEREYARTDAS